MPLIIREGQKNGTLSCDGGCVMSGCLHFRRVLQLPLTPGPFHALPCTVSLHVRSGSVVHQRKLEKSAEHKRLTNLTWKKAGINSGFFFITSAAEKTKTQAENSSKKLKEKTQPLRATMLKFEKNSSFGQISWGTPINMPLLLPNIFNKGKVFKHF